MWRKFVTFFFGHNSFVHHVALYNLKKLVKISYFVLSELCIGRKYFKSDGKVTKIQMAPKYVVSSSIFP